MKRIIEVEHLYKSFKDIDAVADLSFHVNEGELFAFLGSNGAGKSTTISIICGQLQRDSGKVLVDGADIDHEAETVHKNLGVVFQESVLDKPLNVYDNLKNKAALYGIKGQDFKSHLSKISDMLDIGRLMKRPVGKLSGGQCRRIDIARALLHEPKILILDEPTTGLDPQTRKMLWNLLERLRREKMMTIFLTTHYMEEAADADYVVILDSGKIAAEGTPLQLKNAYTGDFIILYGVEELDIKKVSDSYEKVHGAYRIPIENTTEATQLILKYPGLFKDYEIIKGKMDDVFLAVTNKKINGGI